ncbi:MAG: DUF3520 domain-containing protein [Bacteroidetes bacterium]|jgi:Ca-activated chloride channel family protein|nr:DUF3520 domain-containing protein [Bacteroidota bacterium]
MKTIQLLLLAIFAIALSSCESGDIHSDTSRYNNPSATLDNQFNGGSSDISGEGYNPIVENPFVLVSEEPTSTFSIDADGASYSNVRRFLNDGVMPPVDAIRTEELINYFDYDYPNVLPGHPIALNGEVSTCPWEQAHKLIRIGLKGEDIPQAEVPPSNLVFLLDVSGSMQSPRKLGLLKEGFQLLLDELSPEDRVAIVTYAGSAGVVLPSTPGSETEVITQAINQLEAGGSTAGAEGIITAYEIAQANFIEGGSNRVILGTDGDFNVGVSSEEGLIELIEEKRELGVFLTVLGFGTGNLQDAKMEQLANHGNGNYEYIDNINQARKVFVQELGKLYTVAKDVKVQVTFNENLVEAYRLIGYENRLLNNEDFEDDTKDAGEIGSNQAITALYEIKPAPAAGSSLQQPSFTIDFRYKLPDEDSSIPLSLEITDDGHSFAQASESMRFAASVASFGLLLRDSEYKGQTSYEAINGWASTATSYDPEGYKEEFLELVSKAKALDE